MWCTDCDTNTDKSRDGGGGGGGPVASPVPLHKSPLIILIRLYFLCHSVSPEAALTSFILLLSARILLLVASSG